MLASQRLLEEDKNNAKFLIGVGVALLACVYLAQFRNPISPLITLLAFALLSVGVSVYVYAKIQLRKVLCTPKP